MLSLLALRYPRFSSAVSGVHGLVRHQRSYCNSSAEVPKPVHQWTALDTETWLRKKGFEKHIPKLRGRTGEDLLGLSKVNFTAVLGPEDAPVFWRELQQAKSEPTHWQDTSLPDRDDPKWDHLRDLNQLESLVGRTIELPDLGRMPKELYHAKLKHILLTPQRFELVKEFWNVCHVGQSHVKNLKPQAGMILSGPTGVGKTVASYLMACTAFVNQCVLLYIVCIFQLSCHWSWFLNVIKQPLAFMLAFNPTNDDAAQYVLQLLVGFNATRLATIPTTEPNEWDCTTLLELALVGIDQYDTAFEAYNLLLKELQSYTGVPVVYIIDEHQEIFFRFKRTLKFFQSYSLQTPLLQGMRTFTVLSGTAHSKFESNLQPDKQAWIRFIQPFPSHLIAEMICHGGVWELPKAWFQKHKYLVATVHTITGGMPRELEYLHDAAAKNTISSPWKYSNWWFKGRFFSFITTPKNLPLQPKIHNFLRAMFGSRDANTQHLDNEAKKILCDTGLVIFDKEQGCYRSTCEATERVLLRWLQSYHRKEH